jgi:hypothetical protein
LHAHHLHHYHDHHDHHDPARWLSYFSDWKYYRYLLTLNPRLW